MKAEERKELQTNSLIRFFGRLKHSARGGLSRKAAVIWGLVILALVVFIGWRIASGLSEKRNSARWVELDRASSIDDLDAFIQKNRGTVQAHAARLQQARQNLKDGLSSLYTRRSSAADQLKEAADAYEELARQFKATPVLVQECLLGAGKAYEGLGDLDRALSFYNDLQKRFKDGPLAREAGRRVSEIEKNRDELSRLNEGLKAGSTTAVTDKDKKP